MTAGFDACVTLDDEDEDDDVDACRKSPLTPDEYESVVAAAVADEVDEEEDEVGELIKDEDVVVVVLF